MYFALLKPEIIINNTRIYKFEGKKHARYFTTSLFCNPTQTFEKNNLKFNLDLLIKSMKYKQLKKNLAKKYTKNKLYKYPGYKNISNLIMNYNYAVTLSIIPMMNIHKCYLYKISTLKKSMSSDQLFSNLNNSVKSNRLNKRLQNVYLSTNENKQILSYQNRTTKEHKKITVEIINYLVRYKKNISIVLTVNTRKILSFSRTSLSYTVSCILKEKRTSVSLITDQLIVLEK